jgi:hypothetical protein
VPKILAASAHTPPADQAGSPNVVAGIDLGKLDLGKLNDVLSRIDYSSIRKRRELYSRLYYEAIISQVPGRGISFTDMLLLLAHYKLIVDRDALVSVTNRSRFCSNTHVFPNSLPDLIIRTETNKLVTDRVNLDRVRSLLKRISRRRRFQAYMDEVEAEKKGQHHIVAFVCSGKSDGLVADVPAIVVDVDASTPPETPGSATMSGRDSMGVFPESPSPPRTGVRTSYSGRDISLAADAPFGSALQRSRRASDMSALSVDVSHRMSYVRFQLLPGGTLLIMITRIHKPRNALTDRAGRAADLVVHGKFPLGKCVCSAHQHIPVSTLATGMFRQAAREQERTDS